MSDVSQAEAQDQGGGQGEILADPHRARSDALMAQRAHRERWPITDDKRKVIADRLIGIVEDQKKPGRLVVRAAGVLVQMDRLNQQQENREADESKPPPATAPVLVQQAVTINVVPPRVLGE